MQAQHMAFEGYARAQGSIQVCKVFVCPGLNQFASSCSRFSCLTPNAHLYNFLHKHMEWAIADSGPSLHATVPHNFPHLFLYQLQILRMCPVSALADDPR